MAVYKRYRGRKVGRNDKDYDKATWIAEGAIDGQRYHKAFKLAKTKKDAEEEEDLLIAGIRQGEFDILRDKTKFTQYVDEVYLPYAEINNQNFKQKIYETNRLKSFFKDSLLRSITRRRCEEYKRWRMAQKVRCQKCERKLHNEEKCTAGLVSYSTVNRELTTLSKIFTLAQIDRKVKENPVKFVNNLAEPEPRERYLSEDEKARLFAEIFKNKQLLAIVLIGVLAGWRKGQILDLKKTDILPDERKVWICKSKRKPRRKVPVSRLVLQILLSLSENAKDYLFVNKHTGKKLVEFKTAWWNALERAGIEDFHFHDLRHTFSTDMFEAGMKEFAIQQALGHSRLTTTRGYTHVKDEYLLEGLNAVSDQLNPNVHTIFTPSDEVM